MSETSCFRTALHVLTLTALTAPGLVEARDVDPNCTRAGRIAALIGDVTDDRGSLGCGDEICSGDVITTGAGSSVGVLYGGMLTQIGESTRARLDVTPAGTPDVGLEEGTVRMVDPRASGAPGHLTVPGAKADIQGNDAEARVRGGAGEICSHGGLLNVDGATVAPGSCTSNGAAAPSVESAGVDAPLLPALGGSCDPSPVIAASAHIVPTPPVAGPPPGGSAPLPDPPGGPTRNACEIPGCGVGDPPPPPPPPPTRVEGQPPSTTPFPGPGGSFPGGD